MSDFHVTYSTGPRFIDSVNIDAGSTDALEVVDSVDVEISDPVQIIAGVGYEPGQKNRDGSLL